MIAFAYVVITTVNLPMPQARRTPGLAFEFDDYSTTPAKADRLKPVV